MKPTLLVLAAGMGSRYGGLKQTDPVGPSGESIIDYSIFDAARAGFGKVVFVIRRDIEDLFREKVGSRFETLMTVEYAFQELDNLPEGFSIPDGRTKPWGTGQAILAAEDVIKEPFAVINADDFYGQAAYGILAERLTHAEDGDTAQYCMCGFQLRNTLSEHGHVCRGVCQHDADKNLVTVRELTSIEKHEGGARNTDESGAIETLTGDETVSMNMWGFTPSIFSHLQERFVTFLQERGTEAKSEFFIPCVIADLIDDGLAEVKVLHSADRWFGITYRDDKPHVETCIRELVAAGDYPAALFG